MFNIKKNFIDRSKVNKIMDITVHCYSHKKLYKIPDSFLQKEKVFRYVVCFHNTQTHYHNS